MASELVRLDRLGVLVPGTHPFAAQDGVPVIALAGERLLLGEEDRAPEFNQFVVELCRSKGFVPAVYEGTVESTRAAADLVLQGRCLLCLPSSAAASSRPGTVWKPLVEPETWYPWSLLWRAGDRSPYVEAVIEAARHLARRLGWLETGGALADRLG